MVLMNYTDAVLTDLNIYEASSMPILHVISEMSSRRRL